MIYYEDRDGNCPVEAYLKGISKREAARIVHDLDLLEEFGLELGFPYVSHLDGMIWELRTRGRDVHRVLYFASSGRRMVLVHAFTKKTNRTPRREIRIANERAIDYFQRIEEYGDEDPPTSHR